MRVQVEGGFGGTRHTVFGGRRVFVKQWWSKGWRKEEEKEGREHLQTEGLVRHL